MTDRTYVVSLCTLCGVSVGEFMFAFLIVVEKNYVANLRLIWLLGTENP